MEKSNYKLQNTEKLRKKIEVGTLISKLSHFALGIPLKVNQEPATLVEMSTQQVKVALALLSKCLPDLSSVEMSMNEETLNAVISAKPVSAEEWSNEWPNQESLSGHLNTDLKPH